MRALVRTSPPPPRHRVRAPIGQPRSWRTSRSRAGSGFINKTRGPVRVWALAWRQVTRDVYHPLTALRSAGRRRDAPNWTLFTSCAPATDTVLNFNSCTVIIVKMPTGTMERTPPSSVDAASGDSPPEKARTLTETRKVSCLNWASFVFVKTGFSVWTLPFV